MSPLSRYLGVFALGFTALTTACDEPDPEPIDDDPMAAEAVPVVQIQSARALASGSGLARVTNLFSVNVPVALPEASILPWAVGAVKLRLEAINGNGCLVIDSDDVSYVEVTWADQCQSLALTIRGSIRADAVLADSPECGETTCPRSVQWTVDADDLEITVLGQPVESKYRGLVVVDAPIDGGPVGWQTDRTFELDFGFGTYAVTSQARWDVDEDDCITLDLDAEMELVQSNRTISEALEERIGTVVVTGEGMKRCANRCPETGSVFLSYGRGGFLQWTYGARPDHREVEVFTPRGKAFIAELPCNDG